MLRRLALAASALLFGCPVAEPTDAPVAESCFVDPSVELVGVVSWPNPCPWGRDCGITEYLAVPEQFPGALTPRTDLDATFAAQRSGQWPMDSVGEAELAERILASTRVDLLLDGITERPLEVGLLDESTDYSWRGEWEGRHPEDMPNRQYYVEDPVVGGFEFVVFRPPSSYGPGPFPAVVVAHGHGDGAWSHAARGDFAEAFTEAGYLVVIPTMRASEGDVPETTVTRGLLEAGFSTLAIRMYETLLARRIVTVLPDVDPCAPVGLVGHSGGSVSSNLLIRVAPLELGFDAYVSDLTSEYLNWSPDEGTLLDETVPELFSVWPALARLDLAPVDTLQVGYGYPEGIEPLLDFFDERL